MGQVDETTNECAEQNVLGERAKNFEASRWPAGLLNIATAKEMAFLALKNICLSRNPKLIWDLAMIHTNVSKEYCPVD